MKFYTNCITYKDKLLLRGVEDGKRFSRVVAYKPYLFIPSNKPDAAYSTIYNQPLDKLTFDSLYELRDFVDRYKHSSNFKLYGLNHHIYPFLRDEFPGEIEYNSDLIKTCYIDIEVKSDEGFPHPADAKAPITAITISQDDIYWVFGLGPFTTTDRNVAYRKCKNEKELLLAFLEKWDELRPDIISGWNIDWFDIPYLVNRITNLFSRKRASVLSPWRIIRDRTVNRAGQDHNLFVLAGITILDYIDLYRKFTYKQHESMALNNIAQADLGEGKIDYSEYGSLNTLYDQNHQQFIEYNIRDVGLVKKLEDKHGFIQQVLAIAYDAKALYSDAYTSVRLWDVIIHNYLLDQNKCVPMFTSHAAKEGTIDGAYVKDPQCGLHKWVVSFDVNSLYPHLIMSLNISPDSFVKKYADIDVNDVLDGAIDQHRDEINEHNLTCTANMCMFDRDRQGFLPALMDKMYYDRSRYKTLMIEAKKEMQLISAELRRRGINTPKQE